MPIIDEQGRLFGVINVVDAMVVLVVLAVVIAGLAVILSEPSEPEPAQPKSTAYATISYTAPIGSGGANLSINDTLETTSGGTIYETTDVYYSFSEEGKAHIVARVQYTGVPTADGDRVYGGSSVALTTGTYRVIADVLSVNGSRSTIPRTTERVVLQTNVAPSVARAIEPGDRATLSGAEVARFTAVERMPTNKTVTVHVGVELAAWERNSVTVFDGHALRIHNPVTIVTDEVVLKGQVVALGTDDPRGAIEQ